MKTTRTRKEPTQMGSNTQIIDTQTVDGKDDDVNDE
jgi:hypothetical protein